MPRHTLACPAIAGSVIFAFKGMLVGEVRENRLNGVPERRQPILANIDAATLSNPTPGLAAGKMSAWRGSSLDGRRSSLSARARSGKSWRLSFSARLTSARILFYDSKDSADTKPLAKIQSSAGIEDVDYFATACTGNTSPCFVLCISLPIQCTRRICISSYDVQ